MSLLKTAEYPDSICAECGRKHGRMRYVTSEERFSQATTYSRGICGWCKQETDVTEPRDFGYPPWTE